MTSTSGAHVAETWRQGSEGRLERALKQQTHGHPSDPTMAQRAWSLEQALCTKGE